MTSLRNSPRRFWENHDGKGVMPLPGKMPVVPYGEVLESLGDGRFKCRRCGAEVRLSNIVEHVSGECEAKIILAKKIF
jgi:thioredoxin-related protein